MPIARWLHRFLPSGVGTITNAYGIYFNDHSGPVEIVEAFKRIRMEVHPDKVRMG